MATSAGAVQLDLRANTKPFEKDAEGAAARLKSSFSAIGPVVAVAAAALAKFGAECTEVASHLNEVQNVVDQVFPHMSAQVDKWSENLIESFGLSETKAKQYASTMGSMARSMGFTEEQAYKMGTTLAELSGDIASFYDMSADEAYDKLTAIFTGVTQPLRSLGINMTEATLNAYAMAHGIEKTYQDMSEAERTLLRYQFVLDRTAFAQGDFARTSDSWANQLRILSMHFEQLKATIGGMIIEVLLPVIQAIDTLMVHLNALAVKFASVMGMMAGKGKYVGGITSAIKSMAIQSNAGADATANLAAASAGAAGAAGAQDKAMKKLSRTLAGFDRINKLNADSSSGGGGGGGGGAGGGLGALDGLMDDLVLDAPKVFGDNMKRELKEALKEGLDKGLYKDLSHALPLALRTTIRNARRQLGIPKDGLVGAAMSRFASGSGGGGGFTTKTLTRSVVEGLNSALKEANKGAFGSGLSILGGGVRNLSRGGGGAAFHINNMAQVRELSQLWNGFTTKKPVIDVKVAGEQQVAGFKGTWDGIKSKTVSLGATDNATAKVNAASKTIDAMKGKTVTLDATDKATSKVNALAGKVSGMQSKTITIDATDKASAKINALNGKKLNDHWADLTVRKNDVNAQLDRANKTALKDHWADLWFTPKLTKSDLYLKGKGSSMSVYFAANGGYFERNTPRLAVIGDNAREGEIVSPESKFQTMLDKAAGQGNDAETVRMLGLILQAVQGIDANVYLDGRDITRNVVGNINRQVQSTGRSPLIV